MNLIVEKLKIYLDNYVQIFERNITILMSLYVIIPVISTLLIVLLTKYVMCIQLSTFLILTLLSTLLPIYVRRSTNLIKDFMRSFNYRIIDNTYVNLKKAIQLNTSFVSTLANLSKENSIQYKLFQLLNSDVKDDTLINLIKTELYNTLSFEDRNLIPEYYLLTLNTLHRCNFIISKWFRLIEIVIPIQLISVLAILYLSKVLKITFTYFTYISIPIYSIILYLAMSYIVLKEEKLRKRIVILGGIVIVLIILIFELFLI